jgi:CDGSH-type Zn-finger protein
MADVILRARKSGPLVFELSAGVKLVDHEGNPHPLPTGKPLVALCRCGQSKNKPFCDGAHKDCGFIAEETAPPVDNAG